MKKFINVLLSIFSPLAAAPTGWAIYAGVTEQPAFPMWQPAAIVGAIAIITTSIQAGLLVTDIKAYNQGMKNKTEREELGMAELPAWLIFGGCVLAEITLSLLIVVIPGALAFGVLVFPLMTAAGVFAFAVRYDLEQREADRERERVAKKKTAQQNEKPAKNRSAKEKTRSAEIICRYAGAGCGRKFASQNAANAHAAKCGFKPTIAMPVDVSKQKVTGA